MQVNGEAERTIIKAEPGWSVAWPWKNPEGSDSGVRLDPIIAWLITQKIEDFDRKVKVAPGEKSLALDVYPITVDGVVGNIGDDSCVKDPQGRFFVPLSDGYENEADLLANWFTRRE